MYNTGFFQTSMNTFQNARKDIYIAKKLDVTYDDHGNEIENYDKPTFLGKFNYQPMDWKSMSSYIAVYGETRSLVIQCLMDYSYKTKIKEFDKAYLYGVTPKGEEINGLNANFVIKSIRPQNTKIMVVLEELTKGG